MKSSPGGFENELSRIHEFSFVLVPETKIAFALDERKGKYWAFTEEAIKNYLGTPSRYSRNSTKTGASVTQLPRQPLMSPDDWENLHSPPRKLVLSFAAWNLLFQLGLRLLGWRLVWPKRKRVTNTRNLNRRRATSDPKFFQVIVAAARRASLIPLVHLSCVPTSLALHRMLRSRGYLPELNIGAHFVPNFAPHMWIEVQGHVIDPGGAEVSLDLFLFRGQGRNA